MAPRKLLDSEKIDIIALYRETGDTTSTLASRYNVSNSTISRLLKSSLPADEYEILVQQKRAAAKGQPPKPQPTQESAEEEIPLQITPTASPESEVDATIEVIGDDSYQAQVSTIEELLGEKLLLEDQDDEDDEDYSEDEEESSPDRRLFGRQSLNLASNGKKSQTLIQIMPLSEAELPKICYVVIDRAAELITRPLNDFSELGKIPAAENGSATLPIFENHRVARRFSKRSHRVIKVPDGSMLQKVSSYLQAKGITRLLIDDLVYSL